MAMRFRKPLETVSFKAVKTKRNQLADFVKQAKKDIMPMQEQAALFPERDIKLLKVAIPVRNIRRSIDSLITYADMMAFLLEQIDGDIKLIKAEQKRYVEKQKAEAARIAAEREARKAEREAQKAAEQEINN